jgi:hypothetical protein
MGMFDNVIFKNKKGEEDYMQFKCSERIGKCYNIGDYMDGLNDGIYFCHEGSFVVLNGILIAAFDKENTLFSKWGHVLEIKKILNTINNV